MNRKSRWFYTPKPEHTKAVVLIAHGLNLAPHKMDQLAHFFTEHDCDVLRIALPHNPIKWEEGFEDDYDKARDHAKTLNRPLYFVGFSLGALAGLHFLTKHPRSLIEKMVLFAPAVETKNYTKLSAWLAHLFPKGHLPSFNLADYRDRRTTTLAEYLKMLEWQKNVRRHRFLEEALIFSHPKDELIHHRRLEKFAREQLQWKVVEISNEGSLLIKKYHHLMIDEASVGPDEWAKILKNLTLYLGL